MAKITTEMDNYAKNLSLIHFSQDTMKKTIHELETIKETKVNGSEISNRIDNFKK